jgi:hypothetical protein
MKESLDHVLVGVGMLSTARSSVVVGHYATSWKVTGSRHIEVNDFYQFK